MKHTQKIISVLMLLVLITLAFATPVHAFDGRTGNNIVIKEGEIINDDLYVSAESFTLNGTVKGDVIVAGQTITINGTVEGDLIAAGQTIIINGTVMDDARIFGAALQVGEGAKVGSDLIAMGASVETKAGGTTGGDLILGSGQALLAGDVAGRVLAGTSALELRGSFGGNVQAFVNATEEGDSAPPMNMYMTNIPISLPSVAPGLTVADSAKIVGNLQYSSTKDLPIPSGVVAGKVTRTVPEVGPNAVNVQPTNGQKVVTWALDLFRAIVTLVLFGLLLGWLFPKFMKTLPENLKAQPLVSLGWGAITWAAFFFAVLAIILLMVMGAILFGFLTLGGLSGTIITIGILSLLALTIGFILASSYLTKIVVGETLGKWMLGRIKPELAEHKFWPMIVGVIALILVIGLLNFPLLPLGFFGWLVNFVVILFGLGALWIWGRTALKARKTA